METFQFWFWDMPASQACGGWHVTFRLPSHEHAEALAAQLSRDKLDGFGTRIEVSDARGMACRWHDGVKTRDTEGKWVKDLGTGYMADDVKTNGLK